MILTCPNCTTRFLLSAFVLAPDGRQVKCSNCSETWFQLPDPEELNAAPEEMPQDIPESVKPLPEGSSVPALKEDDEPSGKPFVAGAIAAAIIFVMIAGVLIFMNKTIIQSIPATLPIYNALGIVTTIPGEGLVFDRLEARIGNNEEDSNIFLSGAIINLTSNVVGVPMILGELRNDSGETIKEVLIQPPSDYIQNENTLPFEAVFSDVPEAKEIFIRFVLDYSKTGAANGENIPVPHVDETAHQNAP